MPSGTIHALGEGTVVLETQQSSDTTYRVYDYERVDEGGNKRELHLEKSIEVTSIPHQDAAHSNETEIVPGASITKFVDAEYFTVYRWVIDGKANFEQNQPFLLASVIEGKAKLTVGGEVYPIRKGDHFIVPATVNAFQIDGKASLVTSHV